MGAPAITPNLFKMQTNLISASGQQEKKRAEMNDPFLQALMEFLSQQEQLSQPGLLNTFGSQLQLDPFAGGIVPNA